jgi:hypothetical protein
MAFAPCPECPPVSPKPFRFTRDFRGRFRSSTTGAMQPALMTNPGLALAVIGNPPRKGRPMAKSKKKKSGMSAAQKAAFKKRMAAGRAAKAAARASRPAAKSAPRAATAKRTVRRKSRRKVASKAPRTVAVTRSGRGLSVKTLANPGPGKKPGKRRGRRGKRSFFRNPADGFVATLVADLKSVPGLLSDLTKPMALVAMGGAAAGSVVVGAHLSTRVMGMLPASMAGNDLARRAVNAVAFALPALAVSRLIKDPVLRRRILFGGLVVGAAEAAIPGIAADTVAKLPVVGAIMPAPPAPAAYVPAKPLKGLAMDLVPSPFVPALAMHGLTERQSGDSLSGLGAYGFDVEPVPLSGFDDRLSGSSF